MLNREIQLELRRELIFRIQSIGEINTADTTIRMYLNSQCLYVVGSVGSSGEIRQVELDLVPALIEPHRHGANERLYTGCTLEIARSEPATTNNNRLDRKLLSTIDVSDSPQIRDDTYLG